EMNQVADALDKSGSPEELEALKQEAKKHAEAIRDAVKSLPPPGGDPGSAEAAAAAGREQAEAMAGALERGAPSDALQSGKEAMRALNDAKRLGGQSGGFFPEERAGREAGKAGDLPGVCGGASRARPRRIAPMAPRARASAKTNTAPSHVRRF